MTKLTICAVGRLRSGPELELLRDYLTRTKRTGRALGFTSATVAEVEDKKGGGMATEAGLLRGAVPHGAKTIALDERGKLMSSPDFAKTLATWRDDGARDITFLIGGADGLDPGLRAEVDFSLSFGKMVWPHMLARVMLAEQLYRAVSILSGAPYHRA